MIAALGLFLGCIGMDAKTGLSRFTFGLIELYDGIGLVPVAMGFSQVHRHADKHQRAAGPHQPTGRPVAHGDGQQSGQGGVEKKAFVHGIHRSIECCHPGL